MRLLLIFLFVVALASALAFTFGLQGQARPSQTTNPKR
jgi:hypothetical protein